MGRWVVAALVVSGLAAVLAFATWAVIATQSMGSWTGGSHAILWSIIAGAVFTGGLTGALIWLAFYSSRKGYDEPFRPGEKMDSPAPVDDESDDRSS